jgi:hypothetical protein
MLHRLLVTKEPANCHVDVKLWHIGIHIWDGSQQDMEPPFDRNYHVSLSHAYNAAGYSLILTSNRFSSALT